MHLIYKTPEDLQKAINKYFYECDNQTKTTVTAEGKIVTKKHQDAYTIEGLSNALGLERMSLINYEGREEFFDIIKKAKLACLANHNKKALNNEVNTTFSIFLYKNNYGYRDRVEHKVDVHSTSGDVIDLSKLSEEELVKYKELNEKAHKHFDT